MGFFGFRTRPAPPPALPLSRPASPSIGRHASRRDGIRFYHARTGRGDWLHPGAPRIGMGGTDPGRLLVAIPDANPSLCFLLAPDLRPLEVQSDGLRAVAISGFRLPGPEPDLIRLRHPLSGRYLAVTRPGEGSPEGCVVFDGFGNGPLGALGLEPVSAPAVAEPARLAAIELAEAASRPFRAEPLIALLRGGVVRQALAEPLIRLLPSDELERLAALALANPDTLALLRAAMPRNPWITGALAPLAAWSRAPGPPPARLASPAADQFAGDAIEGFGQPQAGQAMAALARRRVAPRRGACLLASVCNEGPYLLEWIAHHRALGFEHLFLYSNDCDDGSEALLGSLAAAGEITWIENMPGGHFGPQPKAYAHALSLLPAILDYRWTAILDPDEYLVLDTGSFTTIADFLAFQETQPTDAVALCWLIFASGGGEGWRDAPTTLRFTEREPAINPHVKSLFRPQRFWHAQSHFPYSPLGLPFFFRNETGALHHHPGIEGRLPAFAAAPSASHAWVNHYLFRSAPEALWKLARGRGDWPARTAERETAFRHFICRSFVSLARGPRVADRRGCLPGSEAELARLRALPGVGDADAEIRGAMPLRLRRLTQAFLDSGPADIPEMEAFRDMLRVF